MEPVCTVLYIRHNGKKGGKNYLYIVGITFFITLPTRFFKCMLNK
uniref:Uncharacterized protein n=1 Tax=Anguilla anguilla TaxID=7936 RepID=A0A0E9X3V8_ANGAN